MKHIIVENSVKGEDQATENNVAKGLSLSQSASPHDVECLTLYLSYCIILANTKQKESSSNKLSLSLSPPPSLFFVFTHSPNSCHNFRIPLQNTNLTSFAHSFTGFMLHVLLSSFQFHLLNL